jgi:hypothetical protein
MILNRLFKSFRSLDVKYLIIEFLLLFLSISLSLYFSNIQNELSQRKKENAILHQMHRAVQADSTSMNILQMVNRDVSLKMSYLLDTGRFEEKPSPKTIHYLAHINLYWQFWPDLTAYQNLQEEGLTLVEDQAVRLSIIKYYDHIQEQKSFVDDMIEHHFRSLTPYVIDEFVNYLREIEAVPEDFESLKKNKRFWKQVRRTKIFCDITADQMEGRIKEASEFRSILQSSLQD